MYHDNGICATVSCSVCVQPKLPDEPRTFPAPHQLQLNNIRNNAVVKSASVQRGPQKTTEWQSVRSTFNSNET